MNVYESIQEMIGGTPLVRLSGYGQKRKLKAEILARWHPERASRL